MPRRVEDHRGKWHWDAAARAEALSALLALLLSVLVVTHVANTRGELFFRDGDSLLPALMAHSIRAGQVQDWAMSPVLFVPEASLFIVVSAVVSDTRSAFVVCGVLNLMALYGAIRVASGARASVRTPVAGAGLGFGFICGLALLESGGSRDSLELASLVTLTTYYSATVIGSVLTYGLLRRILDNNSLTLRCGLPLALVAAVSAFTNPLYLLWAVVPGALALWLAAGRIRRHTLSSALVLVGASGVGLLARAALGSHMVASASNYMQPSAAGQALASVGELTAERTSGVIGFLCTLGPLALAATGLALSLQPRPRSERFLLTVAWLAPVLTSALGRVAKPRN